jgi:DNA-binding MarR family transcriptional regulator/N-acetylglutamate synthase-like GNAT family acetyltransferase
MGDSERVAAVRRFNRFYTRQIGLLNETLLASDYSLSEARVLYELAHRERLTATGLGKALGLDRGYLSRLVRRFERDGVVARAPSASDGRETMLALTRKGRAAFAALDARQDREVAALLEGLPVDGQQRLVDAMRVIASVLGEDAGDAGRTPAYVIRPHRPGDMGWMVHRHGALYAEEYGWDERFEGVVASIVADFLARHDPRRDQCWIAEGGDGEILGSVCLVAQSKTVAQLRLLLVEPRARGLGLGGRLVQECIRFARQAGYKKITLWTNDVLTAARRIYEREGFRLVGTEPHQRFGPKCVAETWERTL